MHEDEQGSAGKVRLDKWLWAARFFKTRALAAEAIDGGKVEVNGDRAKRAKLVHAGDEIRLRQGPVEWQLRVLDVAERRGSAEIAQRLYEETADGLRKRLAAQQQLRDMPTAFAFGDSKPGKRDRRELRRLKGDG
ncbi:RNA-binding S4 domain-containing protein [Gemmatimonas sp.]|jgi:ribosome-associated heat shock protein Hsp15|uniref:RNA-binding S4 domain-containing protein n=1 Tax=Gemmatimonas sp. TaxID=1962908 RepID=UPI0037C05C29